VGGNTHRGLSRVSTVGYYDQTITRCDSLLLRKHLEPLPGSYFTKMQKLQVIVSVRPQ